MLLASGLMVCAAWSNEVSTLTDDYRQAVEHIVQDKPEPALEILNRLIEAYGSDAEFLLGPAFGNILYHQGVAYQMMGQYHLAAEAFERCYVRFPNEASDPLNRNEFRNLALTSWATVEHIQTHYGNATKLYAKALKTEDPDLNPDNLLLNLGICLKQSGRDDRALRYMEKVLQGGLHQQASENQRRRALLQISRHWIERGDAARAKRLLRTYSDLVEPLEFESTLLNPLLTYLGRRTTYLGDYELALRWYSMVKDSTHSSFLIGKAHVLSELKRFDEALDLYTVLAEQPDLSRSNEILLAASLCASQAGKLRDAASYAERVRKEYPAWNRWPDAYTALADRLLRQNRPADAFNTLESIRVLAPQDSRELQHLDFLSSLSSFQLGDIALAAERFRDIVLQDGLTIRAGTALYYEALCRLKLGQLDEAIILFETFLSRYDDSQWGADARYRCAQVHLLQSRQNHAIDLLEEIRECHADSSRFPEALLLLGRVYEERDEWPLALARLEMASAAGLAAERDDIVVQSLARRSQVSLEHKSWRAAASLASEMAESYSFSPVTRASLVEVADAAGTADEVRAGTELLWKWLERQATSESGDALEPVVRSYASLLKRSHTYRNYLDQLAKCRKDIQGQSSLAALLLQEECLARTGAADHVDSINTLRERMVRDFEPSDLSTDSLRRLAAWLVQHERTKEAAALHRIIQRDRQEAPGYFEASIDYAALVATTDQKDAYPNAIQLLTDVLERSDRTSDQELATLEMARIHYNARQWSASETSWRSYLEHSTWAKARAEATYRLGACLDRMGREEEALAQYLSSYIQFEGQVRWSSPAFLRSALIAHERGQQDKAIAILEDMMARMGHLSHPVVNKARTLHKRWTSASDRQQG